jgi:tRNA-specific 2-thiouridylase
MGRSRVVVAMSGGVDSSVTAALLLREGYEVIGVMMRLWAPGDGENRCCPPVAVEIARRVAEILGIPFYVLDLRQPFYDKVVSPFIQGYAAGITPNPCLACNKFIKFDLLFRKALALEADYLATGHYARIVKADGEYKLLKGIDPAKDQSYVLYMLTQEHLARLLFPLGWFTKEKVRSLAREFGLPTADREESQEICFVPGNDYRDFLRLYAPESLRPGPIYDTKGRLLGTHKGLPLYTVGQRFGLGIPYGKRLYVLDKDVERNALIVGTMEEQGQRELIAGETNFISGHFPSEPIEVKARVRYRAPEKEAVVYPLGEGKVKVVFKEPVIGAAPGQAVVFYRGDELLGGGIILRADNGRQSF